MSDGVAEARRRLNCAFMMRVRERLTTLDSGDGARAWLVLDELESTEEQEQLFEAAWELAERGNLVAPRLIERYATRDHSAATSHGKKRSNWQSVTDSLRCGAETLLVAIGYQLNR